jgi:aminoglycoside phosphotransferase family enzyme/predicted kinase
MELPGLIEALSQPSAYPHPAADLQVRHTHISVVFLAGPYAYKVKKPVQFGFLDFSTLERRRHFCEEEVRLNRRLAPAVYLGVVPVTQDRTEVRMDGDGEVIEWAVRMERLPEEATLERRLERGAVTKADIGTLAGRIASFHAAQPRVSRGEGGTFSVVAGNIRETLGDSGAEFGRTISRAIHERLTELFEAELTRRRPLIESRAQRGIPRDTHGDLRLEHIYVFPDRPQPGHLVIVDCIEFNDRFRFIDPVADMVFLVMDFQAHGRRDLAQLFTSAYFQAACDEEGWALLPLYTAYRAAVRGKVDGLKLAEKEVPEAEQQAALLRARAHWLLALGLLEEVDRKPCLVLVAGLPGAGKSTLARALAAQAGFEVIRSDVVRKELAGGVIGPALYTPEWSQRTYAECQRRVEALLFEGRRVLVDANFRREDQRRLFLDLAARWAVPVLLLLCRAAPELVRQRLTGRRGDASDADWSIYRQLAAEWEEPAESTRVHCRHISTDGAPEQAQRVALEALRELDLLA